VIGIKYGWFLKVLFKIFILSVIPILLVYRLQWDAVLPVIVYLQLILIWTQAEIALRRQNLFSAQFEPLFDVKLEDDATAIRVCFTIHNISEHPAYYVGAARILDEENRPIPPDSWKDKVITKFISVLAPKKSEALCYFDKDFITNKLTIEVLYENQLGELRSLHIKLTEKREVLVIPQRAKELGILLKTFEDLRLFYSYIKFRRVMKNWEKQMP